MTACPAFTSSTPSFDSTRSDALQNHGVFVELRLLAGLAPAGRAVHVGDADGRILRVHAADVLFDLLVAGDRDARRAGDESGHELCIS